MTLAALLAAVISALALSGGAETQAHGGIYITTLPSGAAVWMDGSYIGETPLYVDGLRSGRHYLTLTRGGWLPQTATADVGAGRIATVSVVLGQNASAGRTARSKTSGVVRVRAPASVKLFLDGAALSAAGEPLSTPAGDHVLMMVGKDGARSMRIVRVYPQLTTVVELSRGSGPAAGAAAATADEDTLASLGDFVPADSYSINGDEITVHYRGVELQCTIGSRGYLYNGKPGSLAVAPAMVGKKVYLPLTLLHRISGTVKADAR
ncbi:MAG: PEGA domain-containing protein [Candidatus Eremiobacter antarcticus]|nr:PEGA domain-containing protein [Candidatus Eremiobacteraeota bacterium]